MSRSLASHSPVTVTASSSNASADEWPLALALERVMAKVRTWMTLARARPHDAMATAVVSAVGAYFTLLAVLLVLSGPGE